MEVTFYFPGSNTKSMEVGFDPLEVESGHTLIPPEYDPIRYPAPTHKTN